jgi:hypothetical protein
MNKRTLAIAVLIPFAVLTAYTIAQVGYIGIFDYQRHSPAGWQVITDLVIACGLIILWLVPDAKQKGRNPWPYVIITLTLGSFGPLLYLLMDKGESTH